MAWYDAFSRFYDSSLEPHYRAQRVAAAAALDLQPGLTVLDVPCGTGQSFPALAQGVGPGGRVVGVDLSAGMLRQAGRRMTQLGAHNIVLAQQDAALLNMAPLGVPVFHRLHVFLGMSVFLDPQATLANLWNALAPGGRCVLVDVHAEKLGVQGRMVNLLARADITRRFWEPLEALCVDVTRVELPSAPLHGGRIHLVSAVKPG